MKHQWKIAIVGGTGGMGQLFAKELKPLADIIIISRSLEKAKKISEQLGVSGGLLNDCNTADITFVSVPIENTYETCQKLFKIVKPGSLIIDISAVKIFLEKIKPDIPEHISYISMHPLFGPEGGFKDFNVVLIPIKEEKWLSSIQDLLSNLGAQTTVTTAQEHDRIMSKIQVAHHFIYLIFAAYFSDTQISKEFFTRSFRKTLDNFIGIEKNLDVILEIQKFNPNAKLTREEIIAQIKQFLSLDDETTLQELLNKFKVFKRNYLSKNGIKQEKKN